MAGEWLVRLANFENFKHCVVVEFHIRVGESYYCSSCGAYSCYFIKSLNVFFLLCVIKPFFVFAGLQEQSSQ